MARPSVGRHRNPGKPRQGREDPGRGRVGGRAAVAPRQPCRTAGRLDRAGSLLRGARRQAGLSGGLRARPALRLGAAAAARRRAAVDGTGLLQASPRRDPISTAFPDLLRTRSDRRRGQHADHGIESGRQSPVRRDRQAPRRPAVPDGIRREGAESVQALLAGVRAAGRADSTRVRLVGSESEVVRVGLSLPPGQRHLFPGPPRAGARRWHGPTRCPPPPPC